MILESLGSRYVNREAPIYSSYNQYALQTDPDT